MANDLAKNAWFSGFAAGEGCFAIFRSQKRGRTYCRPTFGLGLRLDDGRILEELQKCFGGTLSTIKKPQGGGNPQGRWTVASKASLANLVAYFDRYPLRAKKAQDYSVWREAVGVYLRAGGLAPELVGLREDLAEGRRFDGEAEAISTPGPHQGDGTYTLNSLFRYCRDNGYPEEAKAARHYASLAYYRHGTSVISKIKVDDA